MFACFFKDATELRLRARATLVQRRFRIISIFAARSDPPPPPPPPHLSVNVRRRQVCPSMARVIRFARAFSSLSLSQARSRIIACTSQGATVYIFRIRLLINICVEIIYAPRSRGYRKSKNARRRHYFGGTEPLLYASARSKWRIFCDVKVHFQKFSSYVHTQTGIVHRCIDPFLFHNEYRVGVNALTQFYIFSVRRARVYPAANALVYKERALSARKRNKNNMAF